MNISKVALCFGAVAVLGSAHATFIDFDNFAAGTIITNQYAGVTFSSNAGSDNGTLAFSTANTLSNILCTYTSGQLDCVHDTILDFASPVNNLTFWAIEPNTALNAANFGIYQNGVFTGTFGMLGLGGGGNKFVNLSGFANITKLHITIDANEAGSQGGIGWDSFRFDAVPEPASFTAFLFGGIALLGRKSRKA
ncbi:MAG: hypothetical protein K8R88_09600 [Armatimonadetes bacterium]|nr:hypothetical protein [Armatimonadota bacterium]